MALRGTLSDFGIADIFQLVGHQAKTGVLYLKNREIEVRISFVGGNVVRAEESSRDKSHLIGALMVRADVLSREQLDAALAEQQRTLRRLGDVLIEGGALTLEGLREFTRLQTTETIYRLFEWQSGTYEFVQQEDIDHDPQTQKPIRAEEVLMEAFRMVDEWPAVRKVIPSPAMVLTIRKPFPESSSPPRDADDDDDFLGGLDDAFDAMDGKSDEEKGPADPSLGVSERNVYYLINDGDTVQRIVDVSRLGAFEATKAVSHLVGAGLVEARRPALPRETGALSTAFKRWAPQFAARVLVYLAVAAALFVVIKVWQQQSDGFWSPRAAFVVQDREALDVFASRAKARVERAITVYALAEGAAPSTLRALVDNGYLADKDLRGPYQLPFAYDPVTQRVRAPLR